MKIKTFGSHNWLLGQSDRIDQGFQKLGHEIIKDGPSNLVYSNDAPHIDEAINYRNKNGGKLILNILDCPTHCPEWPEIKKNLSEKLKLADAVTCISKTVQFDIKNHLGLDAKVIYNPIKDVYRDEKIAKTIPFFYAGRVMDSNKRPELTKAISDYFGPDSLVVCGSEMPNFPCYYAGLVDDNKLNELFNRARITVLFSKSEGIGLSSQESCLCESIPVLCSDNRTAHEFFPIEFLCEPTKEGIIHHINRINLHYEWYLNKTRELARVFEYQFDKLTVAKNIIGVYNSI